jgi:hypothetical protein
VFENMELRKTFRPKEDEATGELQDLCSSRSIIRAIKSRRMGWARHVASRVLARKHFNA